MLQLESFVLRDWHASPETGQPFVDATTGECIGTLSATGITFAEVAAHGVVLNGAPPLPKGAS